MRYNELEGTAAIVGFGDAYCGRGEAKTALRLAGEATRMALEDAGIEKSQIDGVLVGRPPLGDQRPQWNNIFCSYLKITPKHATEITIHAAGMNAMLKHATIAIATGAAKYVLCLGVDSLAFVDPISLVAGLDTDPEFELPYEPIIPTIYAQLASRLMYESGMTEQHMAAVSVQCQEWAVHHPYAAKAHLGRITVDDVLTSRMISSPLRLWNCATWGPPGQAGVFIVASADDARSMSKTPIYIRGFGECSTHEYLTDRLALRSSPVLLGQLPNITSTGCRAAAAAAYEMAGIGPQDVDILQTPSNFAHSELLSIVELGFASSIPEAGDLVAAGETGFTGRLPTNTNGGWLSFGQCGVACVLDSVLENVRQLRGQALGKQVKTPEIGLVHALGGMEACQSVTILAKERGASHRA
ncbi:MAG: thiolase family protein [Alphaproteobacteria bacterium]